jgi:hypothetical protein
MDDDARMSEDERSQERSSSPLSCISDEDVNATTLSIKAEALERSSSPPVQARPATSRPQSRAASPVREERVIPPVPADIDLPGLIVSTIVFSNSSKLSLPDLVKHIEVSLHVSLRRRYADKLVPA